jgi:hypothetical protein
MSRHSVHHVRIANHAERIRAEVIVQYAGEEHVEEAIEQLEAAFVASLSELLERRDNFSRERQRLIFAALDGADLHGIPAEPDEDIQWAKDPDLPDECRDAVMSSRQKIVAKLRRQ